MKKSITIILTLLVALMLSSCNEVTPGLLMNRLQKKVDKGIAFTQSVDIDMTLEYMKKTIPFNVKTISKVVSSKDIAKIDLEFEHEGEEKHILKYISYPENKVYTKEDDKWSIEDFTEDNTISLLPESHSLELKDSEFDGIECYEVDVNVDLSQINLSQNEITKEKDKLVPGKYYFSKKTKDLTGIKLDLSDYMESTMKESIKNLDDSIDVSEFIKTSKCEYIVRDVWVKDIPEVRLPEDIHTSSNETSQEDLEGTKENNEVQDTKKQKEG